LVPCLPGCMEVAPPRGFYITTNLELLTQIITNLILSLINLTSLKSTSNLSLMKLFWIAYILIILLTVERGLNAQRPAIGVSVTQDGYATILDEDIAAAIEEALNSALKGTIEYVMESMIDADQRIRFNRLIDRHILSNVVLYILRYEVSEKSNLDEQTYALSVQANVDSDRLEEELDRIGILQYRLSDPTIVFLITERLPQMNLMNGVKISETLVRNELKKSGISIITDDRILIDLSSEVMQYTNGDDIGKAIAIGTELGADIVVFGKSEVKLNEHSNSKDGKIKNIAVTINLNAVKLDNGIILSESSASAVYSHSNVLIAAERALGKASVKVVKKMSNDIFSRWKTEVNAGRVISLSVSNVTNLAQFNSIKNSLKYYLTGHVEVESSGFDGKNAEYSVTASTTGQKMASELENKKFDEFNIKILNSSLHTLSIALVRQ